MRAGRWSGAGVAALAVAAAACVLAPRADAFIYWADQEGERIGRVNNDGAAVDRNFISVSGSPTGVTVDADHIYWANAGGNAIGRANLDGSGVAQQFIPAAGSGDSRPIAVAVDGAGIWWANFQLGPDPGSIGRADLDGGGKDPTMFTNPAVENPCGVALRGGLIYWPNVGLDPNPAIARSGAPPPPSPQNNFVPNAGTLPCWPAVSGSHIYWASLFFPGIFRADLAGTGATPLVSASGSGGVALFGSKLYFSNGAEGTISRANLDGTSPEFAFVTAAGEPRGLAVDSGSTAPNGNGGVPCGELELGKLKKNKKKGTGKLAVEVGCPGTVELDGKGVKPAEKEAAGAGEVELPVKAKGKKKKKLRRKGKTKLEAEVTFTPADGGEPATEDKKLKLVKKRK